MTTYTVDAPPPGTWLRFADHFPHALTPEYTRLYRATFEPAQAAVFERYGVPFAGLATAIIDGHLYLSPKSLIGRSGARLPPRPVLWLADAPAPGDAPSSRPGASGAARPCLARRGACLAP